MGWVSTLKFPPLTLIHGFTMNSSRTGEVTMVVTKKKAKEPKKTKKKVVKKTKKEK